MGFNKGNGAGAEHLEYYLLISVKSIDGHDNAKTDNDNNQKVTHLKNSATEEVNTPLAQ